MIHANPYPIEDNIPPHTPWDVQHTRALQKMVGTNFVLTSPAERLTYECDACLLIKTQPDCIVLPNTTEQVSAIAAYCHQHRLPLTPRGAGTGLSGGALATQGGVLMGLNRMDRILNIDPENRIARVQAGVINGALNDTLSQSRLFFAPDPSSQSASTLGGNIAENAGGVHCVKYGVTHQHIISMQVVLPDGTVFETGNDSHQSTGLNLTQLFCGSEGTLGIITEATVKLTPIPESQRVYLAAFPTIQSAGDCVSKIIEHGLNPAALEFMDAFTVKAVNQAFQAGFPDISAAVLLVELDGEATQLKLDHQTLMALFDEHDALDIREAQTAEERHQLWQARKKSVAAYGRFYPAFYLHDCVIPRSQISHILTHIEAIAQQYDVAIGNVFHAGDGNLHPNILFNPKDADMVKRVLKAGEAILEACLQIGGTLSGEHGIGLEKSAYLDRIFSVQDQHAMQQVKHVFNPAQLLNPNKIFPHRAGCGETRIQTEDIQRQALPAAAFENSTPQEEGLWI